MKLNIQIVFITTMIVIALLGGCKKEIQQQIEIMDTKIESQEMDRLILKILRQEDIEPLDVIRIARNDTIFYQIPLQKETKVKNIDKMINEGIDTINISFIKSLLSDSNQFKKLYKDNNIDNFYVIEIETALEEKIIIKSIKNAQLCIIVDDFGNFDGPIIDGFCSLDKGVTFAILPDLPFSKSIMEKAVKSGHEVIVHIPMEAEDKTTNPGNNAILESLTNDEIYARMDSYFKEIYHAKGANQHMGSLISKEKEPLTAALKYLADKKYFFIDSRTTAQTIAREVAKELNIPFEERNLFLDSPENSDEVMLERLKDLQRFKETRGKVLIITHCFDTERLNRLKKFIDAAKIMGFDIVSASEYVK